MPGNFFLVGLMGSGKTTIGKALAKQTHKPFYDSDHEIERRTGVKIPVIFDIEGEDGFRLREEEVIADLVRQKDIVLATGGGAVIREKNRDALKQHGLVIYLRASVDDLLARTAHDRNRPLLQTADPRAKLEELFKARDPLYREVADLVVDTSKQPIHQLIHSILKELSLHAPRQS